MTAEATSPWTELTLSEKHIAELQASAISPAVALARGYWTAKTKADIKRLGFGESQLLAPGMVLPMFNVAGELCGYQLKPDSPRSIPDGKKSKIVKYENPRGSTTALDVPKSARRWVVDPDMPLLFTEGIKKGDAAASAELAVVSVIGVWNWKSEDALVALDQIPMKNRTVYLTFDNDWRSKRAVRSALRRLANVLKSRGANVLIIDLPARNPGTKVGLDDYFANGGNAVDLFKYAIQIEESDDDEADESSGPVPVLDALPGAPCSAESMIPDGWLVSRDGIKSLKITLADTSVLPTPAIVTERMVDRASGDESIKLAFLDQGRWKSIVAQRDITATASKITALARSGLPVTSNTAAELVRWISEYMAINTDILPVIVTSSVLGWHGDAVFLLPDRLLAASTLDTVITFAAADPGSQAHANSIRTAGTLDGWKASLAPLVNFDRVQFVVAASFASVLLEIVNSPGFVVDLAGPTSGGKTTSLRCAGSVWGQSDPSQPCSIVSTFQSTRVYRERVSALFNSVPVIVDDTMMAKNALEVQSFLYDVVGGQGRGRGSLTGIQTTTNWRTVALISGENSATGLTEAGGTKARTLTIYGRPFGVAANASTIISNVLAGIADNHGHAGPAFVSWLIQRKADWPRWRELYREHSRSIAERAGGGSVISRVAGYIAVVEVASALASEAGLLPWDYQEISATLLHELAGEARGADVAAEALIQTLSWAGGRAESFYSKVGSGEQPTGGWLGRWERDAMNDGKWKDIAFTSDNLRKALEANGHKEIEGLIRQWHERGWLDVDQSDNQARRMKRLRIGDGVRAWCYVIKQSAETESQDAMNGGKKPDDT